MSRKCDITGKKSSHGGNRKHRKGSSGSGGNWRFKSQRTTRTWEPNLREVRVINIRTGVKEKLKVAMSTYKKLRQLTNGEHLNGYALVQPSYTKAA